MRNALFFDIDGTLLSDVTGKIPDSALAVSYTHLRAHET